MKIEVYKGSDDRKSPVRVFALVDRAATLPDDNVTREATPANAGNCPSILIRNLCVSLADAKKTNMVESVRFRRSSAKPAIDLIHITLGKGFSWDSSLENRIQEIIRKRLPANTPLILDSTVRRDFAKATDAEVRAIVTAISPPAVEAHNGSDPRSGLIVSSDGIDRRGQSLTVIMGEACNGGGSDCNSISYRITERAIKASLAYFFPGVQVNCVPR